VATWASIGISIAALPALTLVVGPTRPTTTDKVSFCEPDAWLSAPGADGPTPPPLCDYGRGCCTSSPTPSPTVDAQAARSAAQVARTALLAAYTALTTGMTAHGSEDPALAAEGFSPQVALEITFNVAVQEHIQFPESAAADVQTLFSASNAYKDGDGNLAAVTAAVNKVASDLGG
jgi:hypothetical protein